MRQQVKWKLQFNHTSAVRLQERGHTSLEPHFYNAMARVVDPEIESEGRGWTLVERGNSLVR